MSHTLLMRYNKGIETTESDFIDKKIFRCYNVKIVRIVKY